jgi:hypothetical protein
MNPLESLKRLRKAQRLYNQLVRGETTLLDEYFPFVKLAFTPKVIESPLQPPPQLLAQPAASPAQAQPKPKPIVSYRSRSEDDDLRDALDIGFSKLTFETPANGSTDRPKIKKLGE